MLESLGLKREDVATQVIPRDRHAALTSAIALAGAGLERFATEVRNLQRTEVREVEEPFGAGQRVPRRCRTSATHPHRVDHPASPASCAGTRRWGLQNIAPPRA